MRTIRDLLQQGTRIYVYMKNDETARQFLRDAAAEGFTFGRGGAIDDTHLDNLLAVNDDGTLNHVGYIGRMAFQAARKVGDKCLSRVDYAKYRAGEADYAYHPAYYRE